MANEQKRDADIPKCVQDELDKCEPMTTARTEELAKAVRGEMREHGAGALRACPFCGGEAKPANTYGYPTETSCPSCGAGGPRELTAIEADQKWNTRTPDSERIDAQQYSAPVRNALATNIKLVVRVAELTAEVARATEAAAYYRRQLQESRAEVARLKAAKGGKA